MSKKKELEEKQDDSEDDDVDYCPTKIEHDEPSEESSGNESEHDVEPVEEEKTNEQQTTILEVKPYDESKTNDLWKSFTSSNSKPAEKTSPIPDEKPAMPILKRPAPTTGAASVLDRLGIGKKQKLSTLEKSRLDWSTHKESESLTDDLDLHRRGKDSYVEKKAFLQRTELRQHDHYLAHIKKK